MPLRTADKNRVRNGLGERARPIRQRNGICRSNLPRPITQPHHRPVRPHLRRPPVRIPVVSLPFAWRQNRNQGECQGQTDIQ